MKIKELIEELKKMPQEKELYYVYDGLPRMKIDVVWISKGGRIVASEYDEPVYDDEFRPLDAPLVSEDKYWTCENKDENK